MLGDIFTFIGAVWAISAICMYCTFIYQEYVQKMDEEFGPVFGRYFFMYILLSLASPHYVFVWARSLFRKEDHA